MVYQNKFVVDELNKGYLFKDRLLKPAKVIVVK